MNEPQSGSAQRFVSAQGLLAILERAGCLATLGPTPGKGGYLAMEVRDEEELVNDTETDSEEYRRLRSRHLEFEERLRGLASKRVLTDQEKVEEVRMKKEKLFLKDRMAALQRELGSSRGS